MDLNEIIQREQRSGEFHSGRIAESLTKAYNNYSHMTDECLLLIELGEKRKNLLEQFSYQQYADFVILSHLLFETRRK